jgi:hypothetical protein
MSNESASRVRRTVLREVAFVVVLTVSVFVLTLVAA